MFSLPPASPQMSPPPRSTRPDASSWARRLLVQPPRAVVVFNAKTTTRDGGYLTDVAVLEMDGTALLDTAVDPGAAAAAGDAGDNPRFARVLPALTRSCHGRIVVTYGLDLATAALRSELMRYAGADAGRAAAAAWLDAARWVCAAQQYSAWFAAGGAPLRVRRPLPGADDSARGDCAATIRLILRMAGGRSDTSAE